MRHFVEHFVGIHKVSFYICFIHYKTTFVIITIFVWVFRKNEATVGSRQQ